VDGLRNPVVGPQYPIHFEEFDMRNTTGLIPICTAILALMAGQQATAEERKSVDSAVLYGFVRLDAVYDKKAQSADDWASFLMTQPTEGSRTNDRIYMTARTSRLGVKGSFAAGTVKYQLEGDYNGNTMEQDASNTSGGIRLGTLGSNSMGFRLRHANLQVGNWTLGQTWSTAFDGASMPETVEFNPSLTATALRQPQVRYSTDLGKGSSLHVALENPSSSLVANSAWATRNQTPDLVGRLTHEANWGHVSLMAVAHRYSVFEQEQVGDNWQTKENGKTASATGHLFALGGSYVMESGRLVYGASIGNGAGRYQWASLLQGIAMTADGSVERFKSRGLHVGYTHKWSAGVRSNLNYARVMFDDTEVFVDGLHNKRLSQMQVNTIVGLAKGVEAGVEYEQGERIQLGAAATSSKESRVNFMVMASF
jgi:hypothetical protein